MAEKISLYTNERVTLIDTDLLDVSADLGGGNFESQRLTWANLRSQVDNIYNIDGAITSGDRTINRNANQMLFTGTGNVSWGTASPLGAYHWATASAVNAMIINSNGNIAFGIATPVERMHFFESSATTDISIKLEVSATSIWNITAQATGSRFEIEDVLNTTIPFKINGASLADSLVIDPVGVGIGIAAPTAKLHVNGDFRLVDGSEGVGKALISDVNGLASWQSLVGKGGIYGGSGNLLVPTTVTAGINILTFTGTTAGVQAFKFTSTSARTMIVANTSTGFGMVGTSTTGAATYGEYSGTGGKSIQGQAVGNDGHAGFFNLVTGSSGSIGVEIVNAVNTDHKGLFVNFAAALTSSNANDINRFFRSSSGAKYTGVNVLIEDGIAGNGDSLRVVQNTFTKFVIDPVGNAGIGASSFGTNSVNVLSQFLATRPDDNPADVSQMYVLDRSGAGTATHHFENEQGHIVILFQGAALTAIDATATDGTIATNDTITNNIRTRLNELEARIQAAGQIL